MKDHPVLQSDSVLRWDQERSSMLLVVFWRRIGRVRSVVRGLVRQPGELDDWLGAGQAAILEVLVEHKRRCSSLFEVDKPPRWIKKLDAGIESKEVTIPNWVGSERSYEVLREKFPGLIDGHPGRAGGVRLTRRVQVLRVQME